MLAAAGAFGSVAAVLWVGRRNPSLILMAMFVIWVALPFWGLVYARLAHWVALVVVAGSLAIYGYVALGPPRAQVAKWFLLTPAVSWAVILAVIAFRYFSGGRDSIRASR
jgi:hypothetical protein